MTRPPPTPTTSGMQRVLVPAFSAVGGSAPARPRHAPLLAHPLPAPLNRPAGGRRPQCRPPPASSALGSTVEEDPSSEQCVPPDIVVDNKGAQWTQLTIEARDYPGLRRVVAWILNGMGMRVVSANLRALPGGRIRDTFTVSDLGGRKLRDGAAELLAERLGDFVQRCSPPELSRKDTEFASGTMARLADLFYVQGAGSGGGGVHACAGFPRHLARSLRCACCGNEPPSLARSSRPVHLPPKLFHF